MTTESKRQFAFCMVFGAVAVIANAVWAVVHRPRGSDDSPWQDVAFLAISCLIAAIFFFLGGRRLRELKKTHPDETWLKFLRRDLIMMGVIIAVTAGVVAMPEAWL